MNPTYRKDKRALCLCTIATFVTTSASITDGDINPQETQTYPKDLFTFSFTCSHRINVWYMSLHIVDFFVVNVGKYAIQ